MDSRLESLFEQVKRREIKEVFCWKGHGFEEVGRWLVENTSIPLTLVLPDCLVLVMESVTAEIVMDFVKP